MLPSTFGLSVLRLTEEDVTTASAIKSLGSFSVYIAPIIDWCSRGLYVRFGLVRLAYDREIADMPRSLFHAFLRHLWKLIVVTCSSLVFTELAPEPKRFPAHQKRIAALAKCLKVIARYLFSNGGGLSLKDLLDSEFLVALDVMNLSRLKSEQVIRMYYASDPERPISMDLGTFKNIALKLLLMRTDDDASTFVASYGTAERPS